MTTIQSRRALLLVTLVAIVAMIATLIPSLSGDAADHLDASAGGSPAANPMADINDLYAFQGADSSKTVLAVTVVPAAPANASFGDNVLYEIKVDTTGDAVEDIAYEFNFSSVRANGSQYVVASKSTGAQAQDGVFNGTVMAYGQVGKTLTATGNGTLFTGLRSDPFFFDLDAFLNVVNGGNLSTGRQFGDANATDFFKNLDTLAIVLEVPDFGGAINVWSTTSINGTQIDRIGRPAINTVVNDSGALVNADSGNKNLYNASEPKNDAANFTAAAASALTVLSSIDTEGSFEADELNTLAGILLPDVLPFDKTSTLPAPLNGRALADDVISTSLTIVTGGDPLDILGPDRDANGAINSGGVPAHTDYLSTFPYLGVPHAGAPTPVGPAADFQAELRGSSEVPAVSTTASGVASLSVESGTMVDSQIVTFGLNNAAAAHIHIGDAGENGPVVAFLFGPADPAVTKDGILSTMSNTTATLTAGTLSDLIDVMSGGFAYVNVHTTANPGGEIRGQITGLYTGNTFSDDNGNVHEANIELIAAAGITKGTSATTYSPSSDITRGQWAAFLNRALNLPDTATDYFTDDETSQFEQDINNLAEAGITTGLTATTYGPEQGVTRAQMASFLVRTFGFAPSSTDFFTDDETSPHEANINALAAAGVTFGTSANTFSPAVNVPRDQMASFLSRSLIWASS